MEKEGAVMGLLGRLGWGHSYLFSNISQEPPERISSAFTMEEEDGLGAPLSGSG